MLPDNLKRYAWLSIAAALSTILLKGTAWWLTGSVGLLSDALESLVNLAGALMALSMLSLAAQPADENHAHGHGKAEYFSSAFEGFLIIVAAIGIPEFVTGDMVKDGAVVIDVGINRVDDSVSKQGYRLVGDVKYDEVAPKCSFITPVPGGVGPMTVTSLLLNTLKASKKEVYF